MASEESCTRALRDLADISFSNVDKHIVEGEVAVRLCNYLDVYRNRKIRATMTFSAGSVTPAELSRFQLRKGDVLITKDSETPDDIGVPALITDDLPRTVCGYHLAILRPNSHVDPSFLAWYLQTAVAKRHFLQTANGITRFGLGLRSISSLPVTTPPLPEQRAIAGVLDAADDAIARARAAADAARRVKRGLVQALLTRGISADGRIRDPDRHPHQFTATSQGIFPRNWELVRTRDIAEVGSGVTLGKDLTGIKAVELPYLRVANVQDGYIDTTEMKLVRVPQSDVARYILQSGDVLMTEGGDFDKLGRGGVWDGRIDPCLHQNHIFRVRPNQKRLDPHYLGAVIASEFGKRYFMRIAKRTTNLASINKTQLNAFPFLVPPLAEQQHIVALLAAAEERIQATERCVAAHERLKHGLMQVLLTGRVRVPVGGA